MKDKVLPLVERGEEIVVEDAKSHEKKFMIVPIKTKIVKWPHFSKHAQSVKGAKDLAEVLIGGRSRY